MLVTIFTPVYNRERSIRDVYDSLMNQTDKHFEWLVINDGSTDNTGRVLNEIVRVHDCSFPIRLFEQENKGLNRTINFAIEQARGDMLMRLDSDDVALPDAVKKIHEWYPRIMNEDSICAIAFRSMHFDGSLVGFHPFDGEMISDFCSFRHIFHGTGDRNEVMKVDVYKRYKFPEYEGENFCPEALVWNRIAQDYQCLYLPDPIYKKGFEEDSITSKVYATLKRCCQSTCTLYYEELMNTNLPYKERLGSAIRYYRYAFFAKREIFRNIPLSLSLLALPIGILVIFYDFIKHPSAFK